MTPATRGVHHVGLTVSKLEESAAFFTSVLEWKEVRRDPDYPAIFVSDGTVMASLWQNLENPVVAFDRARNVGLQHLALLVDSEGGLLRLHERLLKGGIAVQFSPQTLPGGKGKHLFCFEPRGIRLEFIWPADSISSVSRSSLTAARSSRGKRRARRAPTP